MSLAIICSMVARENLYQNFLPSPQISYHNNFTFILGTYLQMCRYRFRSISDLVRSKSGGGGKGPPGHILKLCYFPNSLSAEITDVTFSLCHPCSKTDHHLPLLHSNDKVFYIQYLYQVSLSLCIVYLLVIHV